MKLINTGNGQFTRIKKNDYGLPLYQDAADRLVNRAMPGHHASSLAHLNLDNRTVDEIVVEALRPCGDMTYRTGKRLYFAID
jgi:hypothetical protein